MRTEEEYKRDRLKSIKAAKELAAKIDKAFQEFDNGVCPGFIISIGILGDEHFGSLKAGNIHYVTLLNISDEKDDEVIVDLTNNNTI